MGIDGVFEYPVAVVGMGCVMSLSGTACVCDDDNEVVDDATDADCSFRRAVVVIAVSVLVALHAEKNVGGVCIDSGGAHEFVRAHAAMRPLLAFRPVVSELA